jgi:hypothetical protein
MAPNIQYNWSAASGERLRLPVGLGISTVAMFGKLPVGVGVEAYYFVESPDTFGPEWGLRFGVTLLFPR